MHRYSVNERHCKIVFVTANIGKKRRDYTLHKTPLKSLFVHYTSRDINVNKYIVSDITVSGSWYDPAMIVNSDLELNFTVAHCTDGPSDGYLTRATWMMIMII